MRRRDLLKLAAALPLIFLAPRPIDLLAAPLASARPRWDRILLLIELHGGNDGLNTLVPYADDRYYQARPRVAIPRERVLQLSPTVGLHSALEPLMFVSAAGVGLPVRLEPQGECSDKKAGGAGRCRDGGQPARALGETTSGRTRLSERHNGNCG